jgi:hypothetical protein
MEVPARYYLQFPQRLFLPVPVEVRQPLNLKLITRVKALTSRKESTFAVSQLNNGSNPPPFGALRP